MAAHLDPPSRSFVDASDMDLVEYTRQGNAAAFGELWVRHSRAGRAVARSHRFDADDLLSEAFARVFQAISAGGGPTAAFRPYLFTTIRNVSMQWARAKSADASEDLDLIADPSTEEDASLAALDKSLTVSAFRSLPTRWQEALWYSEVEQLSSAEIAPLLGMKANAVSALTYRAREGLRQAWIQAHLKRTSDPECAAAIERLGSFTRGSMGPRESKRVREHLDGCASCSIVADEARQVGSRLALVLLPLAAGVSGTAGFLSWLQTGNSAAGGMTAAAVMPRSVVSSGSSGPAASTRGSSASSFVGSARRGTRGVVAATVGALSLAAMVAAAVTLGPAFWTAPTSTTADSVESTADLNDSSTDISKVATPPAADPDPSNPPTPPTELAPSPDNLEPPATSTPPAPFAQPDLAITSDLVVPPTTPAPTTTPVEPEQAPAPPTVTVVQTDDKLTFPVFSGTAEPLSAVQILDSDGNVLVSTTADGSGAWSISDFGSSITGDPAGREVTVRQIVDGIASQRSGPEHLVVLDAPVILNPLEGSTIAVSDVYDVTVLGVPGASIQRVVNGEVRVDIHALDASGVWSQTYGSAGPGPIALGMRYFDPDSGRHGLTRLVSYTIT
ncbi:sigma-70 family RNA polymerase sigma factor [Agreia pratensis]|uniref:sigma-70 family RNA polymerase sigma factor n=1 Tax=Agreia pratensis TaxID=150121 RepID=UPI001889F75C|nr:sigma-70 family RNA polymerase sigma factor [Agreia pratensis]MBF4636192.1 sigma-70 family RNA polymerase sigma factor [Agreia pratensis]